MAEINMRLVRVEWIDSFGVGQDWRSLKDPKDISHVCISVGYLALDGKNIKVIVPHISPENKEIGSENLGCGDMAIPCKSIISMVDLIEKGYCK